MIWVGFDPYNGVFENGSADLDTAAANHERFILSIAAYMLAAYTIDRRHVYLGGFSWGGRVTGEVVPRRAGLFTGGIAVAGCFTAHGAAARLVDALWYGRDHVVMVLATGDVDYNRQETRAGYDFFRKFGFTSYYFQKPLGGHEGMSPDRFEQTLTLLDQGVVDR
jgi:predicted peptidase